MAERESGKVISLEQRKRERASRVILGWLREAVEIANRLPVDEPPLKMPQPLDEDPESRRR